MLLHHRFKPHSHCLLNETNPCRSSVARTVEDLHLQHDCTWRDNRGGCHNSPDSPRLSAPLQSFINLALNNCQLHRGMQSRRRTASFTEGTQAESPYAWWDYAVEHLAYSDNSLVYSNFCPLYTKSTSCYNITTNRWLIQFTLNLNATLNKHKMCSN